MFLKFMPSDKLLLKELLLGIKKMLMKIPKEKSKISYFNMTELYLLLIQDKWNLKNSEVQVPEPESKKSYR